LGYSVDLPSIPQNIYQNHDSDEIEKLAVVSEIPGLDSLLTDLRGVLE
jgi:hypothetical protein